jgi:uridylate kinase
LPLFKIAICFPKYKRILLKLSGESLMGINQVLDPIDPTIIAQYAADIKQITDMGVQVAVVIGGGNIYRGMNEAESGIERAQGDYMGMLATVINGMAVQSGLEKAGVYTRLQSAIKMEQIAEPLYSQKSYAAFRKRKSRYFWCRYWQSLFHNRYCWFIACY